MANYSLFLFLLTPMLGFLILRFFLGINSVIYLIPFSFILGVSILLDLIHLFDPLFGIQNGSSISLIIMFVLTLILLVFNKKNLFNKIENSLIRSNYVTLFLTVLIIGLLTSLVCDKWAMLDFKFHLSQVNNFIRTNKYPVGIPEFPTLLIPYHYGFDLFCSLVSSIFGISTILTFKITIIIFAIITFLSGFAISFYLVSRLKEKSFLSGDAFTNSFIGALLFYFSGNFLWLDAIIRFVYKIYPVQNNWSLFKTFCAIGLNGGVVNDISSAGVFFASLSIGVGLSLLLFFLFIQFIENKKLCLKYYFAIFIVSLSLFHCAEWILYAFSLSVIVRPVISMLLKEKIMLKEDLLRSAICFLNLPLIIFISGVFHNLESSKYSYMPTFLELEINPRLPFIQTFGRFGNINEHAIINLFSWDFIAEMGLPFIFIIPIFVWLTKLRMKWVSFFLAFFLISFTSPFILFIKSSPPDSLRLLHPGREILNMFFAFYVLDLSLNLTKLKPAFKAGLILTTLPQIIKIALIGTLTLNIYLNYLFLDNIDLSLKNLIVSANFKKFFSEVNYYVSSIKKASIIENSDKELSVFLNKNYMNGNCGLSSDCRAFNLVGIPCYTKVAGATSRELTFTTLNKTLDPYLIKELNIRWIYLDPQMEKTINTEEFEKLKKGGFLKEVFSVTSIFYPKPLKLFEFVNLDDYIRSNPRKVYWAYFKYMTSTLLTNSDNVGNQFVYLFKSEKQADAYLREIIKATPSFKSLKPFTQAIDEAQLKQQPNLYVKYVD